MTFQRDEFAKNLVFLIDFGELVNIADPDAAVDTLQEISFYALLAVISISSQNQAG